MCKQSWHKHFLLWNSLPLQERVGLHPRDQQKKSSMQAERTGTQQHNTVDNKQEKV